MSGIDGPGGIGGPKGPTGPADAGSVDGAEGAAGTAELERADAAGGARATESASSTADIDALAAEVAAGRLTPKEAIEQLVESTATPDLSPSERAELREMLADLVANDPYFAGLGQRI